MILAQKDAYPHPWYMVIALTMCNIMSNVDRFAMTLLVTPMQQELQLNDTQTGLIGGLVTGLFYALAGLPLARIADQFNRKWLVIFGLAGWSLMTMGSGLAIGFWTLCLARLLLSVGEASLGPAANSMIANVFPLKQLSKPLSAYATAGALGNAVAALLVAAFLALSPFVAPYLIFDGAPMSPWRIVMLGLGLAGIVPLLMMLKVREPVRHASVRSADFREFLAYLKPRRYAYAACYFGYALFVLPFIALFFWLPTAFERAHQLPTTMLGAWLGTGYLVAGVPGTLFGGWLADRLEQRGRRDGKLQVMLIATAVGIPVAVISQLAGNPYVGIAFVWGAMFCAAMSLGPATAAIQAITVNEYRAQAASVVYLLIFVVAFMGIPVAGAITDHVFKDPMKLGQALNLISIVFGTLAFLLVWRWRRDFVIELNRYEQLAENKA